MNDGVFEFDFDLDIKNVPHETLNPASLDALNTQLSQTIAQHELQLKGGAAVQNRVQFQLGDDGYADLGTALSAPIDFIKTYPQWDGELISVYTDISAQFTTALDTQLTNVKVALEKNFDLSTPLFPLVYQDGTLVPILTRVKNLIDSHSQFFSSLLMQITNGLHSVPVDPNDRSGNDLFFENYLYDLSTQPTRGSGGSGIGRKALTTEVTTGSNTSNRCQIDVNMIQTVLFVTMSFMTFVENIFRNQAALLSALYTITNGLIYFNPKSPQIKFQTTFPVTFLPELSPSPHFLQLLTLTSISIPAPLLPEEIIQNQIKKTSTTHYTADSHHDAQDIGFVSASTSFDNSRSSGAKDPLNMKFTLYSMLPHIASRLYAPSGLYPSPKAQGMNPNTGLVSPWAKKATTPTALIDFRSPFSSFDLQTDTIDSYYSYLSQFFDFENALKTKASAINAIKSHKGMRRGGGGGGGGGYSGLSALSAFGLADVGTAKDNQADDQGTVATRMISTFSNLPIIMSHHTYRIALLFGQYDIAYIMGSSFDHVLRNSYGLGKNVTTGSLWAQTNGNSRKLLEVQLWFLGLLTGLFDTSEFLTQRTTAITRVVKRGGSGGALGFDQRGILTLPTGLQPPMSNTFGQILKSYHSLMTNTAHVVINNVLVQIDAGGELSTENTPHLGLEAYPQYISDIKLESNGFTDNQSVVAGASAPRGNTGSVITAKRSNINHLQNFFKSFVMTSVKSDLYRTLCSLFPSTETPFSLLFSTALSTNPFNNNANCHILNGGQLAHFETQPHLYHTVEQVQTILINHFKSMEFEDFYLFFNIAQDEQQQQQQHRPTPQQLEIFFNIYTQWIQNKAYYPHSININASKTNPALQFITPLQLYTQNPIFVQPRVVHLDQDMTIDDDSTIISTQDEPIITLDLCRSAPSSSSLPTLLATTAIAMRSNSHLEQVTSSIAKVSTHYQSLLRDHITSLKKLQQTTSKRSVGGGGGGGMGALFSSMGGGGLSRLIDYDDDSFYGVE